MKIEVDVNLTNLESDLVKTAIEAIEEQMAETIGDMECATHAKGPNVKIEGTSLDDISITVNGCCADFISEVNQKLSEQTGDSDLEIES